jgi:hypothetical protein
MNTEWYYVENNITVGPTTLTGLAERFGRAGGKPCLVWTTGMSDWADAKTVPAILNLLQSMSARNLPMREATRSDTAITQKTTLAQRVRHELVEYLAISAYLFVCFSSLLFYKLAILRNGGIEFTAFGLALVKALILGQFILVLQAVKIGERGDRPGILLVDNLKTSFLFLIFLVALNAIEEIGLGLLHGLTAHEVLGGNGRRLSSGGRRRLRIIVVSSDTVFFFPRSGLTPWRRHSLEAFYRARPQSDAGVNCLHLGALEFRRCPPAP